MAKIWVDDIRPIPAGYDKWFKSVDETISYLKDHWSEVTLLDIDHDSGDYFPQGGDYIKILDWLEEHQIALTISIHSGNPVGIRNMMRIIQHNGWIYQPQLDELKCDVII